MWRCDGETNAEPNIPTLLHILIVQHREVAKFENHVRAVLASNPEGEVEVKVVAGPVMANKAHNRLVAGFS